MALLKQIATEFGTIRITRSRQDGATSYFQNGSFHSQANRHGTSVCAYVHIIHDIIRQAHAHNILVLGCAGGTLATMLRRLNCKVTVVDINPLAFAIARTYFRLPNDVRCVRRDGMAYVRTTKKLYDAVVIDVFGANNDVPRKFKTELFFHRLRKILSPSGIMVMNVITSNDTDRRPEIIAGNAQKVDREVTLFDWPGQKNRNTVIVGGRIRHIHIPSGKEPAWIKQDMHGLIRRKPRKYAFS